MHTNKHNRILCSSRKFRNKFIAKKSKINQLKTVSFSWSLLFIGVFVFLLFLGFTPIKFVVDIIKANYTKTETIKLYARNVLQDKEAHTYTEGWWNQSMATLSPQVEKTGSMLDFTDSNASFYTGGNYSLSFSGFRFLEEDLGVFEEIESEEELEVKSVIIDEKRADVISEELEIIVEEENNDLLEESVEIGDDVVGSSQTDIVEEPAQNSFGVADESLARDSEEENLEDEIIEDIVLELVEDLEEINNEFEIDIVEEIGVPEVETVDEPLSFGNYFDSVFNSSAQAEEIISSQVDNLSDLGVFKSATIKLSMAINETGEAVDTSRSASVELEESEIELIHSPINEDELLNEGEVEELGVEEEVIEEAVIIEEIVAEEEQTPEEIEEMVIEAAEIELVDIVEEIEEIEEIVEIVETHGNASVQEEEIIEIEELEIEPAKSSSGAADESLPPEADKHTSDSIISWFNFVKIARAQTIQTAETKMILWYSLAAGTDDAANRVWHQLDTFDGEILVNSINGDYFSYDASFLNSWEDIDGLELKIEAKVASKSYIAYLDSVWVEAEYEPSKAVQKINQRKEWEEALQLVSGKLDFKMNEQGVMKFHYQKNRQDLLDSVGEFFGLASYWEDVDIKVRLIDVRGQELDLPLSMIFEEDGAFEIRLPDMPRGYKPGKYQISFYIEDSSGGELEAIDIRQDFSWGVLALNFNKSIYSLDDDSAFLQMAVLDDFGHTLCDAELALNIIAPSGLESNLAIANGQIVANPECGPDNVIDTPDYYAYYMIDELGEYTVSLTATTTNGVYNIQDKFTKTEVQSFEVERIGPTRIFPLADYDMYINIKANENFSGPIFDYIPSGFKIATQTVMIKKASSTDFVSYNDTLASSSAVSKFRKIEYEYKNEISWSNIDLEIGDELFINYVFDAPDISPEFYLLGSLEMAEFDEDRQWQIASDAIAISTSTNGLQSGWTDAANAWDNGTDTYASRDIPKKTGGGEPANYIQSSVNSVVDLGGDINSVEIGIEGYAEDTIVTTYLVPYFDGSTVGTEYNITGTTLGTSDDNVTDYVDITGSVNAPATWTWADIQNLDIRVYGGNTSNSANRWLYIDQIRIRVDYTSNTAPNATFVSASQRVEDSGIVDISIEVSDTDSDDDVMARIDYVAGNSCDFGTPLDPILDETDANATSTNTDDPVVENDNTYQVGTALGYINTSEGANTVSFDWFSASNTPDMEGDYCLQVTVNDQDNDDLSPATTTLVIDNKAPTVPGIVTDASSTKDSIKLFYGATSTDIHFNEYIIYYATSSPVDETDYAHSSTTDINLDNVLFNSEASTTISGLLEDTTYYFSVWAYDDYGHKSSSTVFSFTTNRAPTAVFTSASPAAERTDTSGIVDISIDVDDLNSGDLAMAKIEYVQGVDCDFATPLDPTLDENNDNISSTYGLISLENDNEYQVGNSSGWILTPATNTIAFDWDTITDVPGADDTYCLRLTASDQKDDQNILATTTVLLDNVEPTAPGQLLIGDISTSTVEIGYGATSTETNFLNYKMYYKIGTSEVTEGDDEHIDTNLDNILFNGIASTTIIDLIPNTDYIINIWVHDSFGNASNSVEISFKTDATVSNDSLTLLNPVTSNWVIADGASEFSFEAVASEGNGWNTLDDVVLRLADSLDLETPFSDLEFTWNQTSDTFTETGTDANSAVSIATSSSSSCGGNTCTLDFNIIFNNQFATSSIDYAAELFTSNDGAITDFDSYSDIYQVKVIRVEQVHYRWRNDDGGE